MHADLTLALSLADAADSVTMQYFRSASLSVRTKSDQSPVSEADEAAEQAIRGILERERRDDGVVGEEFGTTGTTARRWIIDPIDGTKNYVRGVPVFATLIALEEQGRITTGVVSAPAMKLRWWARRGEGAFGNGERLRVSTIRDIGQSFVGYDSITDFTPLRLEPRFLDLLRACDRSRGFG
ncbi:MAG TPA: inositol monophosphatase family protein, partial [Thermoanaerobaculia bacterium]|nr:inositol monophosphatase family protein [Thermoanaerobaculia bacterium]